MSNDDLEELDTLRHRAAVLTKALRLALSILEANPLLVGKHRLKELHDILRAPKSEWWR